MKRYSLRFAAIIGVVLIGSGLIAVRPRSEPTWNGRSLNAWLDDYVRGSSKEVREPAEEAIRSIGSNAVPVLVRMLAAQDGLSKRILLRLNRAQNWIHFRVTPARDQHSGAWMGFQALGEAGESAIPELGRLLVTAENVDFVPEALSAISAKSVPALLNALPRVGADRQYAIVEAALRWPSEQPAIAEALGKLARDQGRESRICGARLLGRCRRAPGAVQALVAALDDGDFAVRWQAVASLTELGTNATSAVPALERLALKPELIPALIVSNALFQIQAPMHSR